MPYCPKCGSEVDERMVFCPKCGASLKTEKPLDWREQRRQWREQRRQWRHEYGQVEWREKYEKHEQLFIGPLIGGLVLIMLGFLFYLGLTNSLNWQILEAIFLVITGLIILAGALLAYALRRRISKHPQPSI